MVVGQQVEVRQTRVFAAWLTALRDKAAAARIAKRMARVQIGLLGDVKPVGDGVAELRVDYGPGYRCISPSAGRC